MQPVKTGTLSQPQDDFLRSALQALILSTVGEKAEATQMDLQAGKEHFLADGLPVMREPQHASLLGDALLHSPRGLMPQL